jgi:hypothetical protein
MGAPMLTRRTFALRSLLLAAGGLLGIAPRAHTRPRDLVDDVVARLNEHRPIELYCPGGGGSGERAFLVPWEDRFTFANQRLAGELVSTTKDGTFYAVGVEIRGVGPATFRDRFVAWKWAIVSFKMGPMAWRHG